MGSRREQGVLLLGGVGVGWTSFLEPRNRWETRADVGCQREPPARCPLAGALSKPVGRMGDGCRAMVAVYLAADLDSPFTQGRDREGP